MAIKIEEKTEADFIDKWENGFGWIARPEEAMERTSHAFWDEGLYLVDPLDAENLDQKIEEFGEVKGIILLFDRHERDSVELAERYGCPIFVPEWFERSLNAEVKEVSGKVPDTDWEIHQVVDSKTGKETALYNSERKTLIVADALGTTDHMLGRGEKLGMNPFYRLSPPVKLLEFDPERIFCGHGEGIQENASEYMKETLRHSRLKAPSAFFNAFYEFLR